MEGQRMEAGSCLDELDIDSTRIIEVSKKKVGTHDNARIYIICLIILSKDNLWETNREKRKEKDNRS